MRAGQVAIEYLILVGFVLLVSAPLWVQVQQASFDIQRTTTDMQAREAMDSIGEAARLVYAQGEPAKVTFRARFPKGVSEANVSGNVVRMRVDDEDYVELFDFNVSGDLPDSRGSHKLVAEAVGRTNVTIREE